MAVATAPAPSPSALKARYDACLEAVARQYAALPPAAQAALPGAAWWACQTAAREAWEQQDYPALKAAFTAWGAYLEAAAA